MRTPIAIAAAALLSVASLGEPREPTPAERALPWLRGLPADALAPAATPAAAARLAALAPPALPDEACATGDGGALELVADLAPAPGHETLLVSYAAGAVVLDARGAAIATAPAFACHGSADAIEAVAVGDLRVGAPVIALAATAGGRAERATWLVMYAVRGDALAPIFAAPVEERRGETRLVGEVTVVPGGLLRHRAPTGEVGTWRYDRAAGRFVLRELVPAPRPAPTAEPGPGPLGPAA